MSKAVAKKESGVVSLVEETPDWMSKDAGQGVEGMDASDVEIPRLVLLQSLSKQVVDGDERPGVFYHSVLEDSLGDKLRIIPVYVTKSFILWKPRHEGGGILARADDGVNWNPPNAEFIVKPLKDAPKIMVTWKTKPTVAQSGLDQFGSSVPDDPDSQPAATKMINIVCLLPDFPEYGPVVVTLQRGAMKVAKKLVGKLKLVNAPSYGQVFEMVPEQVDDGSGVYHNFTFTRVGYVTDKKAYEHYKEVSKQFAEMGVKVKDAESLQEGKSKTEDVEDGPIAI